MPIPILFDFAAVHVIGDRAAEIDIRIDFVFTDHDSTWTMRVARGVLNARAGASERPALTVTGPKSALTSVLLEPGSAEKLAAAAAITLTGDAAALRTLAGVYDTFDASFPIVTP